jgi:hypothetical protein
VVTNPIKFKRSAWISTGGWYVSNVSIIFYAPCLFYTICFMFCLPFVAFLCDFRN